MLRLTVSGIVLSLLSASFVFFEIGSSMPMQQSYELRCRGGGLKFNSTAGRTSSSGEQMMNVTIDFAPGTQGAGTRKPNLNPGQCSWIDRGFRQGEPPQIRLEMVSFAQQAQARHGSPVDRSPTAAERYPDAQNVPQYLSNSDRYWTFWVYNTSNGYLQATGNKYFKQLIVIDPKDIKILPPGRDRPSNINRD